MRVEHSTVTGADYEVVHDVLNGQIEQVTLAGNKVIGITMFFNDLQKEFVGVVWYQTADGTVSLTRKQKAVQFSNEMRRKGVSLGDRNS